MCSISDKVLEIPFTYASPKSLGNSFTYASPKSWEFLLSIQHPKQYHVDFDCLHVDYHRPMGIYHHQ